MVHRGPGSRQPSPACVSIFNHPILGRIIRSNILRLCSLAFIIFFTSKISLMTIFLWNKAYGITSNPSDFMAFRVAFMYYEFLSWQCLLDGNLQLFVEVLSCRNCCYGKKKKAGNINAFRGRLRNGLQNLLRNCVLLDHASEMCAVFFLSPGSSPSAAS